MRATFLLTTGLVGTVLLAACDRQPEAIIFPEFDFTFSFESGVADWSTTTADLGDGSASVAGDGGQASAGSRSVRIDVDNPDGAGKVWMTRGLEVTPDQRYSVELSFDLRTEDHETDEAWKLIVGLRDTAPTTPSELDYQGDTSSEGQSASGAVWVTKSTTLSVQADDEGRLFLTLGVWGTTAGTRAYFLDNVSVVLTRS